MFPPETTQTIRRASTPDRAAVTRAAALLEGVARDLALDEDAHR